LNEIARGGKELRGFAVPRSRFIVGGNNAPWLIDFADSASLRRKRGAFRHFSAVHVSRPIDAESQML
jgi:predicted Ser/Thr protein kinase